MTSQTLTTIVGDVIVVLGLVLNFLKTRQVGKAVTPATPPKPPST